MAFEDIYSDTATPEQIMSPKLFKNESKNSTEHLNSVFILTESFQISSPVFVFLCFTGIIANMITMHILRNAKMPKAFKTFLIGLTLSDFIVVLSLFTAFITTSFANIIALNGIIVEFLFVSSLFVSFFGRNASGWFTVLLSFERFAWKLLLLLFTDSVIICSAKLIIVTFQTYSAVYHPFTHPSFWTLRKLIVATGSAIALTIIFNFITTVRFISYAEEMYNLFGNDSFYYTPTFHFDPQGDITIIIEFLMSAPVVLILNAAILIQIQRTATKRLELQSGTPLEKQAGFIGLTCAVILTYIILFSFPSILMFLDKEIIGSKVKFYIVFTGIILNSSGNWIIYCLASKNLRGEYAKLFTRKSE